MNKKTIKEFLKLTMLKFIVFLGLIIISPFIISFATHQKVFSTIDPAINFVDIVWLLSQTFIIIPIALGGMLMGKYNGPGNLDYEFYFYGSMVLGYFAFYIISCFVVSAYNKIKVRK